MAGAPPKIRVDGLRELQHAFAVANRTLATELRRGLRDSAEPVRADAEILAGSSISNMGPPVAGQDWRRMRVGVTKTSVYVAPRSRSAGGKRRRRNLFELMAGRSLEPALDANVSEVTERLDDVLGTVGQAWDRA
jgi:hypothetical protein